MNKSTRSVSASGFRSGRSGAGAAVAPPQTQHRNISKPSIPSNVDTDMPAEFNSIGYYGGLNNRLDD